MPIVYFRRSFVTCWNLDFKYNTYKELWRCFEQIVCSYFWFPNIFSNLNSRNSIVDDFDRNLFVKLAARSAGNQTNSKESSKTAFSRKINIHSQDLRCNLRNRFGYPPFLDECQQASNENNVLTLNYWAHRFDYTHSITDASSAPVC